MNLTDRIYLDHAAATPLCAEAVLAMRQFEAEFFGNASAVYYEGQRAKVALKNARTDVASILQIQPDMVTFTSGGTESNNLAIRGVIAARHRTGVPYSDMEIITTPLEHPATLQTVEYLAQKGVVVHYVPVDKVGRVKLIALCELLNPRTVLMSISYVNSEIGTIADLGVIRRMLNKNVAHNKQQIVLHVDAAQAPLWLPCELSRAKIDLMSFDAGKFGGPKGIGILARRKGVELAPIIFGGGQEGGLRPGTEPVAQIVGCATSLKRAQHAWVARSESVCVIRDYFIAALVRTIPKLVLNGTVGNERVANNVNISIPGLDSEFTVIVLDAHGIAASTKSACSSVGGGVSIVVKTVTDDTVRASTTLRFTLGESTTKTQLDTVVAVLKRHVDEMKNV